MELKENMKLGPQVAQLALQLKVKQSLIARNCDLSRISLNRFFRGRSELRAGDLVKVLRVLGIDLEKKIAIRMLESDQP